MVFWKAHELREALEVVVFDILESKYRCKLLGISHTLLNSKLGRGGVQSRKEKCLEFMLVRRQTTHSVHNNNDRVMFQAVLLLLPLM